MRFKGIILVVILGQDNQVAGTASAEVLVGNEAKRV